MRTRSLSNLPVVSSNLSTSNPKRRNRRHSKQPFIFEESPVDTMADQRTMAELLRAPTEGYAEAIMVPSILAKQFELKHSLINMMTSDQFLGLEKDNPHDHIRWGSLSQRFDESFHEAWDRYKDLLRACPHLSFTELHQLDTFYNALNPADQDSLNAVAGEIAKLTHAVNQQTSVVTTAMTAILKQFQATPPPAFVKAVEETCVTYGGAHPWSGSFPSNIVTNPKSELKTITTRSGLVIDGPTFPTTITNSEVDERVEETLTDPDLAEYTIKVLPPSVQKYKPPSQREYVVHQRDPLHLNIPYPLRTLKQKQQEKDEVQIHKFWQMFKQLHININLANALILMPKYQKMLKALLSNKEKLQELENTPLNENCSAVILKKLPKKLGDPEKFLIPCGLSELKCKALADLGVSINLMPLSIWKKLGLPELNSTRMTLEPANRAICTPAGIARDVFIPVGKFTFLADFVIVDYESDPRVPHILGRPFLWTARALIDVHGEEMILRDGDERLTLNMRHDTSSYSNQPQKESINLINIFNNSKGGNVLPKKLLDLDPTKDLYPPLRVNPLSGSTAYFSTNLLLEELADELALITFPPKYDDDLQFDVETNLKEIEFLLYQDIDSSLKDSNDQTNHADNLDFSRVDALPSTNNEDKYSWKFKDQCRRILSSMSSFP
nr:reverse transcriptase domain-containing protein [Tanacetum cinerariifolium]